jgi:hypothetical protein
MGKGKGKRGCLRAHVYAYAWLLTFSSLRVGLLAGLRRYTRAHCSFPTQVTSGLPCGAHAIVPSPAPSWVLPRVTQRWYVRKQMTLAQENMTHVARAPLAYFYSQLFC